VVYFRLCLLLTGFLGKRKAVLDIRTGHDGESIILRFIHNGGIRFESLFYPHVTVISESLREDLGICSSKSHILPLGADIYDLDDKTFNTIRLLYVGTFDYRHIERTIEGFALASEKLGTSVDISYDIVGYGLANEEQRIKQAIQQYNRSSRIRFHGRIPHKELRSYLARCNIGVAFIPITKQYDCQPSTKVFEYLLAGMPVVATSTRENRRVIHGGNGVLIEDTAEAFCDGLMTVSENRNCYNSDVIRRESLKYSWENIVRNNLECYMSSLVGSS
jgi:glycosyltransferase involved in cell wall biosynthesis